MAPPPATMVKVAGGGCGSPGKIQTTRITGKYELNLANDRHKFATYQHMHKLSYDLIVTPIPAATKATVAGGSGGRRKVGKHNRKRLTTNTTQNVGTNKLNKMN